MLKLIRLEWKKNHPAKYLCAALILAVVLCLFICALSFFGIAEDPDGTLDAAAGYNTISSPIELFSSMTYLIFTSVMLSTFIVSAYQNKTMNLMFSYPIKRKKILISQMLAVWIFCFAALTLTKLLLYGSVLIGSQFASMSFRLDFNMLDLGFYAQLLGKSAVIVTMGFISLFIGLAMKSSKAAIISSFLLIILTQANVGDLTMANNVVFPLVLTAISLAFAFLSVWRVEYTDLN